MTAPSVTATKEIKAAKKWMVLAIILFAATGAYYVIYTTSTNLNLEDSIAFRKLTTELNMYTLLLLIGLVVYFAVKHFMRWKWLGDK